MHNQTKKIGVYSLNNQFVTRTDSLEQTHQESIREKVLASLNNMMPRIKEETSRLITEKVQDLISVNSDSLKQLKYEADEVEKQIRKDFSFEFKSDINSQFSNLSENIKLLKSTLALNSVFNDSLKMKSLANSNLKIENDNCLNILTHQMNESSLLYQNMSENFNDSNLKNLKFYINEKIKIIYDTLGSSNNLISEKDSQLLSSLISTKNKIEYIQNYLGSQEKSLIERTENHQQVAVNSKENFNKTSNQLRQIRTKFDISSIPNYKLGFNNIYN